jgi:hypothetical protein
MDPATSITTLRNRATSFQDEGLAADSAWRLIRDAMQGLKFGSIILTVRDGLLIQVNRAEGGALLRACE